MTADTNSLPYQPHLQKTRKSKKNQSKKYNQNSKPINMAAKQHKGKIPADFVDNKTGTHNTHARQKTRNVTIAKKWATSHEYAAANKTKVTEEETITWKTQAQKKKKKVNPKKSAK